MRTTTPPKSKMEMGKYYYGFYVWTSEQEKGK
jgi:hypothetical protein